MAASDSPEGLARHLAWLELTDCPCPYAYRGLGRLYGVDMGKGWVRLSTVAGCRHHDVCDKAVKGAQTPWGSLYRCRRPPKHSGACSREREAAAATG